MQPQQLENDWPFLQFVLFYAMIQRIYVKKVVFCADKKELPSLNFELMIHYVFHSRVIHSMIIILLSALKNVVIILKVNRA